MQIGANPVAGPGPAGAPGDTIGVDPVLARRRVLEEKQRRDLEELKRAFRTQTPGTIGGPNPIPVLLSPVTKAVRQAFNGEIDTFKDKVIKGKVTDQLIDEILRRAGLVAEKVGFVAGKVLDPLLSPDPINTTEEERIARILAAEVAARTGEEYNPRDYLPGGKYYLLWRQRRIVNYSPQWLADP